MLSRRRLMALALFLPGLLKRRAIAMPVEQLQPVRARPVQFPACRPGQACDCQPKRRTRRDIPGGRIHITEYQCPDRHPPTVTVQWRRPCIQNFSPIRNIL